MTQYVALRQQSNLCENVPLIINISKKNVLPLLDAVSDRNLSQMWDQNFTFTFQILKIFFLLYIAKVLVHTL